MDQSEQLEQAEQPTPTSAASVRMNIWDRDNYTGEELRIPPARPGAMDAYKIPSRSFTS